MKQEKDSEHIFSWFSCQHLGPLPSLVSVEMETQHAHIVVEFKNFYHKFSINNKLKMISFYNAQHEIIQKRCCARSTLLTTKKICGLKRKDVIFFIFPICFWFPTFVTFCHNQTLPPILLYRFIRDVFFQ